MGGKGLPPSFPWRGQGSEPENVKQVAIKFLRGKMQARRRMQATVFCALGTLALARMCSSQEVHSLEDAAKHSQLPAAPVKPFHEDWSTPAVDRSIFAKDAPKLAETDEIQGTGFVRERFFVNWRPKDPFDLYIIRPKGVRKPPVILTLYSYPDDTENFKNNAWCEAAVNKGYAVVGFVSAATGHRIRFRMTKEWFVLDMQESLATTAHDVQLILDYLKTRDDLDTSRIGMFGVGSGGSVAILASAVDPRLVAVDLLGPWGDWPTWLAQSKIVPDAERAPFLKKEFLGAVAPLDPVVWLPKSKAKALRLQDVRRNASIPDEAQVKLEGAAPDFSLINEYGNGRAFLTAQPAFAAFDWIKEQLKEGTKSARPSMAKSERIHVFPAMEKPAEAKWPNVGGADTAHRGAAAKSEIPAAKDNH